ncbi:MAG: hypothetical protein WAU23_15500 [Ferruginibacter sp.]
MKFTLYVLDQSGEKTKIYSPMIEGEDSTLYEQFIAKNEKKFKREVVNIDERIWAIGHDCGLFEEFFDTKAGKFNENLCTFKDKPNTKLRLFFIEYGSAAIILGSGGSKETKFRATQDKPELYEKNRQLGEISLTLQKAQQAGHFSINPDGTLNSTTDFTYNSEDYE